jgi:capsular exopolysaccharide synthesis family protein
LWFLREHWLGLAALVTTVTLGTAYFCPTLRPKFDATAVVNADRSATRTADSNDADHLLATRVKLIQSDKVLRPFANRYFLLQHKKQFGQWIIDPLKVSREPIVFKHLRVTRAPNTLFLMINSRSTDPETAATASKAIANSLVNQRYSLLGNSPKTLTRAGFESSIIRVEDLARPLAKPIWPNVPLALSLAFLGSLILGIVGVILYETSDITVQDPQQASRLLGTDVICALPSVSGKIRLSSTKLVLEPLSRGQRRFLATVASYHQAIRGIRNNVLLADIDRPIRSLLVTSAYTSEGKSTTSIQLAVAHAEQCRRTLIIDADLRRPVIQKRLKVESYTGLSDVLEGRMHWTDAVKPVEGYETLDILPSGYQLQRPTDLIDGPIAILLKQVTAAYDLVIVDTPPTLGFTESVQIAPHVDGVFVVAHAGQTSQKAVADVLCALRGVRANLLGVVLNHCEADMDGYNFSSGSCAYKYRSPVKVIDIPAVGMGEV